MKFPRTLGIVSEKHESGGRGVGFVSSGRSWGDPGGDSYGVHQLSGAYSMGAFLESEWGEPYARKFDGMKPNTNRFNKQYKIVAKADPIGFAYAQKAFYANTHYLPVRNHAEKLGYDVADRGVQEALFSMSVQHGRAKHIVSEAAEDGVPLSTVSQIRGLYKHRTEYVNSLRSLSKRIKRNITTKRYPVEMEDAVAMAGLIAPAVQLPVSIIPNFDDNVLDGAEEIADGIKTGFKVFASITSDIVKLIFVSLDGAIKRVQKVKVVQDLDGVPDFNEDDINLSRKEVPWMHTAKGLMGTDEVSGRRNNPTIIKWARDFGGWVKSYYTKDSIPWCGLFTAHCFNDNNIPVTFKNPLGARNWAKFGYSVTPQYGATMVFSRRGGGHVGFYVSEDKYYYHILGGNQSDTVNTTKVSRKRFLDARWPIGWEDQQERLVGRIVKKFDGKVSTNEQ